MATSALVGTALVGQTNVGVIVPPPPPVVVAEPYTMVWHSLGGNHFETGIDRGVLYVDGLDGVAWNGITSIVESPSGGEARAYYIDGIKYLNLSATEEFAGTISALYSPEEFDLCDGALAAIRGVNAHHQVRRPFCLSFRSRIGNDIDGIEHGYKIHIVYNAMAQPAVRNYRTLSAESDPSSLSWKITTRAIPFPGLAPTAHIMIDTTKTAPHIVATIEKILYGTALEDPRVPMPDELYAIFTTVPSMTVTDNGDGTFTVEGDDSIVTDNNDGTFTVNSDSAVDNGDGTFTLTS